MRVELHLLLIICSIEANCIQFFPFGEAAGDVELSRYLSLIQLSPPFPLLGELRTSLRVGYVIE